jgi:S-adenosylmethionine:tRNA-ribosyltransferase-isomerase (queuine synthetase)
MFTTVHFGSLTDEELIELSKIPDLIEIELVQLLDDTSARRLELLLARHDKIDEIKVRLERERNREAFMAKEAKRQRKENRRLERLADKTARTKVSRAREVEKARELRAAFADQQLPGMVKLTCHVITITSALVVHGEK